MIKYYLFFAGTFALYGGLYWFSTRYKTTQVKRVFALATFTVFALSAVFMYINLFFCLYGVLIMYYVSIYIGANQKIKNRIAIKNGALGGFWLAIPLYVYLVSNT